MSAAARAAVESGRIGLSSLRHSHRLSVPGVPGHAGAPASSCTLNLQTSPAHHFNCPSSVSLAGNGLRLIRVCSRGSKPAGVGNRHLERARGHVTAEGDLYRLGDSHEREQQNVRRRRVACSNASSAEAQPSNEVRFLQQNGAHYHQSPCFQHSEP
jgi:hypothetical protein